MFKIFNGRDCFFQWDINQKLIVEDKTITEVHFCNKTDDCSLVCEVYEEDGLKVVNVPNILLQNNWDIRAYAYQENHTKVEERFKVKTRSKPADYVYTETEVLNYETLSKRLDAIEAGGGGGGGSIVIDQIFDATSARAQSGIAIGGVIGDIETALDGIIALQNNYIAQAVSE